MNTDGLTKITFKDMIPADVLLWDIPGPFFHIVSAFDGLGLNHASLYLGAGQVAEAVPQGIVVRPWDQGPLRSPQAIVRRAGGADTLAVLAKANELVAQRERYAYGQLLLAAGVCLLRRSGVEDPIAKAVESLFLYQAGQFIDYLHANGKKPMICSELVYRCFAEAGSPWPISVDLFRGAEVEGERREAILSALDGLSANFVSPGDLLLTPSLGTVGVVDVKQTGGRP
jgi:hypothetical protein